MAKKYYSILGVAEDATEQEIKRAFRGIARECHPDVAGDDPVAASRFKEVRQAYEVLVNPEKRAKYDRKGQRLGGKGESFFKAFYRATGKSSQFQGGSQGTSGSQSKELNLDDLFAQPSGQRSSPPKQPSRPPPPPPSAIEPDEPGDMTQGEHVNISLDVPGEVAKTGGTVTVNYQRLQRSTAWRPGATDAGLIHVNDFADVRIIPGTRDGQRLREPGLGNAGPHGGAFGDLIARVRVVGQAGPSPSIHENVNRHMSSSSDMDDVVDITIVEAILGGRITVMTPQGETRLAIPSGTSSHGRFRLKGRGEVRLDGTAKDYYVGIRVVVPETLDEESRILIEEFAKLNPDEPRK